MRDSMPQNYGHRAWYPTLLSVYPVLALYSANVDEVRVGNVVLPLLGCLAFSVLVGLLLQRLVDSPYRRGAAHAAVLIAVLGFAWYAPLLQWLVSPERTWRVYLLGPALVVTAVVAFYFTFRWLSQANRANAATRFLNHFAGATVFLALLTAAWSAADLYERQRQLDAANAMAKAGADRIQRPDVYVLMLDAYGGVDLMRDLYDFDNEPFAMALEERGFFVARKARANYATTKLALSSALNVDYLQNLLGAETVSWKIPLTFISDSFVAERFKALSYDIVSFETGVAFTEMPRADFYLQPNDAVSDFSAYFLNTTLVAPLLRSVSINAGEPIGFASHRARVRFAFEQIRHVPRRGNPVFVFAHIVCPHGPRTFNADGTDRVVDPKTDSTEAGFRFGYIEQVKFVNARVLDAIDAIQAHSPEAVIIIQGDHGPRFDGKPCDVLDEPSLFATLNPVGSEPNTGLATPWPEFARENLETLNAFYFPGETQYDDLHDAVSQVNTFRVVFSRYFGDTLPLVPDRSFLQRRGQSQPYLFDEVGWTANGPEIRVPESVAPPGK